MKCFVVLATAVFERGHVGACLALASLRRARLNIPLRAEARRGHVTSVTTSGSDRVDAASEILRFVCLVCFALDEISCCSVRTRNS